jgi:hypothetical protein
LNEESLVVGTPNGKFELSSTATTAFPAPIAYKSSVALGLSETIRFGLFAARACGAIKKARRESRSENTENLRNVFS